MKKLSAILILTVMLTNGAGFYVYYSWQLKQIRREMRQALKLKADNELDVLKLTHAQYLQSRMDEHEVKVAGKMYDVARITIAGDSVYIYCLHDKKEDSLIALVNEIVAKPLKNSSVPSQLMQFIGLIYIVPAGDVVIDLPNTSVVSNSAYCFSDQSFLPPLADPPPPQQMFFAN